MLSNYMLYEKENKMELKEAISKITAQLIIMDWLHLIRSLTTEHLTII